MEEARRDILKGFLAGRSKADLGREFNLSRERIRQIIKSITGENSPSVLKRMDVDWTKVNLLRKIFGIRHNELSNRARLNPATVRHIFIGDQKYLKGRSQDKVLRTLFEMILERNEVFINLEEFIKPDVDENDATGAQEEKAQE